MSKRKEYLALAEECRALAARALNVAHREQLLKIALGWEELAKGEPVDEDGAPSSSLH
jgi:hypothetical protein